MFSFEQKHISSARARVFRHRAVSWTCGSLRQSQAEYCFGLAGSLCVGAWAKGYFSNSEGSNNPWDHFYVSELSSARLKCLSWSFRSLPKSLPEASQDVQNRFLKGLSMPSKRKCVLSGLWDEFGTRLGHPLGGHLGRKIGPETIQNRFLFTTKLKHRFRRVWNEFWNEL